MFNLKYTEKITDIIKEIDDTQSDNIKQAAELCAETINSGKLVHLFGSGQSYRFRICFHDMVEL